MYQEIQSDSSSVSNDLHFELIQNKLDKLMQMVSLTEKKPSQQMEQLLQLNDQEDEMVLYSKQVNLELQSIINEQNAQLKAYRNEHFKKQISCEQMLMQQRELLYQQNKKLNDTLKYLAQENLNARIQYNKLTQNNTYLVDFIKKFIQDQLSQTTQQQLEQYGIITQTSFQERNDQIETIEIKQQKKINALERFLVQILKSFKNNDEREELLKVKNQLEQKIVEMSELSEQFQQVEKDNENHIKKLKQAGLLANNKNSRGKNQFVDNFPLKRKEAKTIQTRGKKINYKEIIKEFDEYIEDSFENENSELDLNSSTNSSNQKVQQQKNSKNNKSNIKFVKNSTKINKNNKLYDYSDSDESQDENCNQKSNKQSKKSNKKNASRVISSDSDKEVQDEQTSGEEVNKKNQKNNKKLRRDNRDDDDFGQDADSDFDVSMAQNSDNDSSIEINEDEEDSEYESFSGRNKQSKKAKPEKKTANKAQKTQVPEKKKAVNQSKKRPNKVLLRKQQENQDRLFNQLDIMLDM